MSKIRIRGIAVLACLLINANCGGGSERSLTNQPPTLGIQNPDLTGNESALKIIFTATIADNGSQTFSITANLRNKTPLGNYRWSDETMLGQQFSIQIGNNSPLPMQYFVPASSADPLDWGSFQLVTPQSPTADAYRGLHNVIVKLLNSGGTPIGRDMTSPQLLANYPFSVPSISQRILSNCVVGLDRPDIIRWSNFGNSLISTIFLGTDDALKKKFVGLPDSGAWQMETSVFDSYFSAQERQALETPEPGVGYGSDVRDGRMILVRSSTIYQLDMPTNPRQILPVVIEAREEANYQFEYQGGCGL